MGLTFDPVVEILASIRALGVAAPVAEAIGQLIRVNVGAGQAERPCRARPAPASVPEIARLFHKRAIKRADILGGLMGDAAWHMLLSLTAEDGEWGGLPVSCVCFDSGAPVSTALRHLTAMEQMGLVKRVPDPRDGRRTLVQLSEDTRRKMQEAILSFCVSPPPLLPDMGGSPS